MVGMLMFALANAALAEDAKDVKTIKGEAKCAKCSLHETKECQTVIVVEPKDGKKVTYYVTQNDVAKDFHGKVCKESKKVTAKGVVKKTDDGKMELTLAKIDVAKEKVEKEKE